MDRQGDALTRAALPCLPRAVDADRETCNSLWIGPRLGALERACLRSVLRQGHTFRLWCYERPDGVPDGVEVRDAAEILPRERIVAYRNGSPALFANLFRYALQRRGLGIWLDCDLYLLRPLTNLPAHLFGWEAPDRINNAVIRFPPDSPLLDPLITLFDEREVPPWLSWRARAAAWWRLRSTGRTGLADMPWGAAGPLALTWYARRTGLASEAQPAKVFYPAHWTRARWIADPAVRLDDVAGPETRAVHLWNKLIADMKEEAAPPGSFLARLQAEGV